MESELRGRSGDIVVTVIDGVEVPYLGIKMLIESKSTYREKDQLDAISLRRLRDSRN